jgi:5-methylthioadenosine/S-adenosylhomocysteine deaminase
MQIVDTLLSGGTIVTMNAAFDVYMDGAIAIQAGKIAAVGPREAILQQFTSDDVVDCRGQYIMPGLINAHTHVPMTLLRGLADDLRLDVWLMGYCMPTEREFVTPEFCRLGTQIACAEMIRSGVTAFADMYYYESDVSAATAEAGMRGVLGQTVLKFPSPDAATYEDSMDYVARFIEQWKGHPLITPAIAPHAPYSTTPEILRECAQVAAAYDVPLLIHIAETRLEVDDNLTNYGETVVPYAKKSGLFEAKVLAAHCIHINGAEMNLLRDNRATVAHCPTSNLKLAAGIAQVKQMLDLKLTVGIGTDGPASNNDLDMFEEMRLAAILAKTAANDPTALPARQALLMATRQGAEALFLGDRTGSLEVGKQADLLTLDGHPVHNMPQFHRDPDLVYSRIVYAGKSSDVRDVMCDGRWLMRDKTLLTIDEAAILQAAEDYAHKVDAFLAVREQNILSKLLAIGGLEQSESFEVQAKAVLTDEVALDKLLHHPQIEVIKTIHYRQYDTYFLFDDPDKGRVRYREDDLIDEKGEVELVRSRLTYTMPTREREFSSAVLLSRSRFISRADRPLRFYREYFQPVEEREVHKDRRRWHIHYQGVLFYINIDQMLKPQRSGTFIEIKSRTWSAVDAENKATRIREMLGMLGIGAEHLLREEYLEFDVIGA